MSETVKSNRLFKMLRPISGMPIGSGTTFQLLCDLTTGVTRRSSILQLALVTSLVSAFPSLCLGQSGSTSSRATGREYGVNLTFAVYQYDAQRSQALEEVTRLSGTFSSADEEIAHLKDKYKLEDVAVRHVRSAGLRHAEVFHDAVLLGPEYMTFWIGASEVIRGYMKLEVKIRYANEPLLEVKGVELDNYETVILKGGKGMFGAKQFIGAGGRQESAPVERTLLLSVTPEIVPIANLRNRPTQLSHPVDEFGTPLKLGESDRFTPPVPVDRVVPRFETGRPIRGSVLVAAVVTPEGKVINVRVLRSIDPIIDDRAVDAFRQYKFSPALLNGNAVHATVREEIFFANRQP